MQRTRSDFTVGVRMSESSEGVLLFVGCSISEQNEVVSRENDIDELGKCE
jgi:hypothetical protein